ncbi:MAG: hypothetical protein JKY70_22275 [Mucilaginibacter sp.]|nr:hypothetical protein [Mucilaginibacter sp.]
MQAYTFHITFYDAAFFGMLFVGLTFVLLLSFGKKDTQKPNRFLAGALFVAVLWVAQLLINDLRLAANTNLPLRCSLAFGPLLYFYVLKVTRPNYKLGFKDLLHFVPLLSELVAVVVTQKIRPTIQVMAFISVSIYLPLCFKLIESFYQQQKFNDGDRRRHKLQWLKRLLTGFSILWLLWIPLIATDHFYYHDQLSSQAYFSLYLLLMAMLIWMSASAFLKPELSTDIVASKPLLPAELKQKALWLKHEIKLNRYYQDPELSLASLAEELGLHTHELSRILNTVLKKKF